MAAFERIEPPILLYFMKVSTFIFDANIHLRLDRGANEAEVQDTKALESGTILESLFSVSGSKRRRKKGIICDMGLGWPCWKGKLRKVSIGLSTWYSLAINHDFHSMMRDKVSFFTSVNSRLASMRSHILRNQLWGEEAKVGKVKSECLTRVYWRTKEWDMNEKTHWVEVEGAPNFARAFDDRRG